ncbi:hypothetical protein GJ496_006817 [Pomphorhynchus laevis]|nr:hypothetical protein GJ496_006817 [Pomphorhynchus laevis]
MRWLIFNTLASGYLMGCGDIIQQYIEKSRDKERTCNMALVGLLEGPALHYWYQSLDCLKCSIFKKILLDQTIASPCINIFFLSTISMLENNGRTDHIKNDLYNKLHKLYIADCCFWPALQYFNFRYIPKQFRVLYVCGLTITNISRLSRRIRIFSPKLPHTGSTVHIQ